MSELIVTRKLITDKKVQENVLAALALMLAEGAEFSAWQVVKRARTMFPDEEMSHTSFTSEVVHDVMAGVADYKFVFREAPDGKEFKFYTKIQAGEQVVTGTATVVEPTVTGVIVWPQL